MGYKLSTSLEGIFVPFVLDDIMEINVNIYGNYSI